MGWYLRACTVCGGDATDDPVSRDSAVCILCGRSIPRHAAAASTGSAT